MKKNLLVNILLLSSILTITSCSNNSSNSENSQALSSNVEQSSSNIAESSVSAESAKEESSKIETPSDEDNSSVNDLDPKYYSLPDWTEVSRDVSLGGDMLDISVGRDFMTGADYLLYFTLGNTYPCDQSKSKVVVSNPEVLEVSLEGSMINAKALHAGKTYLRIYDSNEIIRYCGLITVSDSIAIEDMEEYLVYEADYWRSIIGWGDSYVLTFLENGVYNMAATFSNTEYEPVTGTYEYVGLSADGKDYYYKFTDEDIATLGFTGFYIARTGTFMYLQEESGTANILFPKEKAEEYFRENGFYD